MAEDKKTIGLTDANKVIMDQVVELAGFKHDMDAAKFAFAFAVSRKCEPVSIEGVGTIWNVGSFDDTGELKGLVQNLYPGNETPYRAVESLLNSGLMLLDAEMKARPALRIPDLLKQEAARG